MILEMDDHLPDIFGHIRELFVAAGIFESADSRVTVFRRKQCSKDFDAVFLSSVESGVEKRKVPFARFFHISFEHSNATYFQSVIVQNTKPVFNLLRPLSLFNKDLCADERIVGLLRRKREYAEQKKCQNDYSFHILRFYQLMITSQAGSPLISAVITPLSE